MNINTWKSLPIEIINLFKFQNLSFPCQDPFGSVVFWYAKKSFTNFSTTELRAELSERSTSGANLGRQAIGRKMGKTKVWHDGLSMLGFKKQFKHSIRKSEGFLRFLHSS